MKKFIIFTFVCALAAGAAFAQGWSVSGAGELGTMLNFVGGGYEAIDEVKAFEDGGGTDSLILKENSVPVTWIGANTYNNIEYYGYIGGNLGIRYNNSGLSAGFDFVGQRQHGVGGRIDGEINYSSPIAQFQYVQAVAAGSNSLLQGNFAPDRLWGLYNLMDGKITLEAAAASRDNNFWYSSGVVNTLFGGGSHIIHRQAGTSDGEIGFDNTFGMGFAKVDHHNYLVVNTALIDGLEVGFMMPSVFAFYKPKNNYEGGNSQYAGSLNNGNADGSLGYYDAQSQNAHVNFLNNSLLKTRIGVKYGSGPISVGFQFALLGMQTKQEVLTGGWIPNSSTEPDAPAYVYGKKPTGYTVPKINDKSVPDGKYLSAAERKYTPREGDKVDVTDVQIPLIGLYLGANYAINDQISAGLGFQGHFHSQKPTIGFGANVGFGSGPINAGLALGLHTKIDPTEDLAYANEKDKDKSEEPLPWDPTKDYEYWTYSPKDDFTVVNGTVSYFALKPQVSYAIVENYLAASLDASLFFKVSDFDASWKEDQFGYEITPQIFFNVAGTGAATNYYGGLNTAIIVRYKVAGWVDGKDIAAYKKQFQPYVDRNSGKALDAAGQETLDVFKKPKYHGLDITFKWTF